MIIEGFIWLTDIIDKLENKHGVAIYEVESVFVGIPIFNRIGRGHVRGEDLYRVMGQTDSGRYLTVFFIYKMTHEALVISARDMTAKEKKYYAKRKR
jgi:uncharacterized DUF497 family protein